MKNAEVRGRGERTLLPNGVSAVLLLAAAKAFQRGRKLAEDTEGLV